MATHPQGWYADPSDPTQFRWWDGENWTDHVTPTTAAATVVDDTEPAGSETFGWGVKDQIAGTDPDQLRKAEAEFGFSDEAAEEPGEADETESTDALSDAATDDELPPPPPPPAPQPPAPEQAEWPPDTETPPLIRASGPATEPPKPRRRWLIPVIAAVVLLAAFVAGVLLFAGNDDDSDSTTTTLATDDPDGDDDDDGTGDGTGTFDASIDAADSVFTTEVVLGAGDAIGVVVEPSDDDFDPVFAFAAADRETRDALAAFEDEQVELVASRAFYDLQGKALAEGAGGEVDGYVVYVIDDGSEGETEQFGGVVPVAGRYQVIVAGFAESTGEAKVDVDVEVRDSDTAEPTDLDSLNVLIAEEHAEFLEAIDPLAAEPLESGVRRFTYPSVSAAREALTQNLIDEFSFDPDDAECVATATYEELGLKRMLAIDRASGGVPEDIPADLRDEFLDVLKNASVGCGVEPPG